MKQVMTKLTPEVKAALEAATIDATSLKLTGQLARPLYLAVNKVIEQAGGKWNRKTASHVFPSDPRMILGLAVETGEIIDRKKTLQFFETPPEVADRLIELADIQCGFSVLEPSAGKGSLLRAIRRYFDDPNHDYSVEKCHVRVTAVEIDEQMWSQDLSHSDVAGFTTARCADFMEYDGADGPFDVVVMNPPFSNGQDVAHIKRAFSMLVPGGRVAAICANGPRQQELLKPDAMYWYDLPPNSFKESGTGVNAAIVVLQG